MKRWLLVLAFVASVPVSPGFAGWLVSATDHFDLTYTRELGVPTEGIGREAERAYRRVKSDLGHELSLRPLLVLFSSRADLERAVNSRTVPGNREHILVPLDAPAARVGGDLVHKLSHVFVFDIVPSLDRRDSPRWIHEGLAEFERGLWDAKDVAVLREMLQTNALPRLSNLRTPTLAGGPRVDHVIGHAAFEFLVSRTGRGSLRQFLLAVRQGSLANPADVYLAGLRLPAGDFDRAFDEYLRARFR